MDKARMIVAFMSANFNLLEIINEDKSKEYWLSNSFEESVFNSTASVDFCKVEGFDVTPFIESAVGMFHNNTQFSNKLSEYIEKSTPVYMMFSKYIKWRYYSSFKTSRK